MRHVLNGREKCRKSAKVAALPYRVWIEVRIYQAGEAAGRSAQVYCIPQFVCVGGSVPRSHSGAPKVGS